MARNNDRGTRRTPRDTGRRTKKKPCALCRDKVAGVDYKDVNLLRKYMSDRGKIRARRVSGNCAQHQRAIALAIKTARELALLPYAQRTVTERSGGGRGRGPGGGPGGGRAAPGARSAAGSRESIPAGDVGGLVIGDDALDGAVDIAVLEEATELLEEVADDVLLAAEEVED